MTRDDVKLIANPGYFTAFVMADRIDVLIRSADWYEVPPIQRYLYNMAASEIRMEDAKTEMRVYTFDRYEQMRQLIIRSNGQEWDVAFQAVLIWRTPELRFGVVHLEKGPDNRGDLLLGDDPDDFARFASLDLPIVDLARLLILSQGIEGSDV